MNKKKVKKKIDIGTLILTLILYAILYTVYGVLLGSWVKMCIDIHYQYDAIKSGIIVEAELTEVLPYDRDTNYHDPSHVPFYVKYEYQDGDIKYQGPGYINIKGRENAEAYLGEKIKIHIDGKGHSIAVGGEPNTFLLVILTIILVALFYPVLFWQLLMKQINRLQAKIKDKKSKENSFLILSNEDDKKIN